LARKKIRVRGHRFSDAPAMYMKRTKFDRSHVYKTTFDSGKLIPVFIDEVLPGDTTRMSVNYFARLATPIKPIPLVAARIGLRPALRISSTAH
jgi:hypothetical protein